MESLVRLFSEVFKNKKIIITGDTGFKGSWLGLWLLQLGAEVYGYSLPPERVEDNFNVCNLASHINHIDNDIRDLDKIVSYFKKVQPDICFHLAAQPLVLRSLENPYETFSTNIMGTVNFFEAVRTTPSIKIAINVTSDKCYENKEWDKGYLENDRMGGKDPYSASKSASEIITTSYLESFFSFPNIINISSVRAGNVIGAGDWNQNRIIPDYFKAKKTNSKLVVRNPNSTRPWQHVLEPLSGYLHLASKLFLKDGKKYIGGWNFGPNDDNNYTVLDLIYEIQKYDKGLDIKFEENNNNVEAKLLKLNISKAINEIGWKPTLDFAETIKHTVNGYISDFNGDSSIENRLQTLEAYIKSAKKQKLSWSL